MESLEDALDSLVDRTGSSGVVRVESSNIIELAKAYGMAGYGAGVSFPSKHDLASETTCTVISNTSEGTWPVEGLLDDRMTT